MTFGRGQSNFHRDVPEAPAQVALSRLKLYLGEWFLDTRDGTPWNTQVLGKYTGPTRDMVLRTRILGTPGVRAITGYASQVNRDTRQFSVQVQLDTIYGPVTLQAPI